MRRSIELGSEVARDPEKQYMSGYRMGYSPLIAAGGTVLGIGSSFIPAIATSLGVDANLSLIASALGDTSGETISNYMHGVDANTPKTGNFINDNRRNLGNAASNLTGYFAGAGLARNIFNVDEETPDWQKGLIDSAGAIAGETVSDLSLDALRGDIRWRDVPMEIVRTPQQLATGMGTMVQNSADGSIGMNMVEGASDGWEDRRARARWNPRFARLVG